VETRKPAIGMAERAEGGRNALDGGFMFGLWFAPGLGQGA
jgi:hypothetical protein